MSQVSEILVKWTPETSGRVASIQLQSRIVGTAEWTEQSASFDPSVGEFRFTSNAPATDVEVRARYRMIDGVFGAWFTDHIVTAPAVVEYDTITGAPTNLSDINPTQGGKLDGIEDNATNGAVIGGNVKNPDGTLYVPGVVDMVVIRTEIDQAVDEAKQELAASVGEAKAEVSAARGEVATARGEIAQVRTDLVPTIADAKKAGTDAAATAQGIRTDLTAEVDRAKGAEGTITSNLANVKTTADRADAAVTDEATVRARDDVALGNRASTVEAQLRGDQDSGLAGKVRDEATARANAVSAVANRTSTVEAKLNGDQDSKLAANVRDEATARTTADEALSGRVSTTEAKLNGDQDSTIAARIRDEANARVGADEALSTRAGTLEAQMRGDQDSNLAAKIRDEATARTTAIDAVANRTTSLEAAATNAGNLVPNTAFLTTDGWFLNSAPNGAVLDRNRAGVTFQIGGVENNLTLYQPGVDAHNGLQAEALSEKFAVQGGEYYQVQALTASHRCRAWVSLFYYDTANTFVGYAGENFGARINAGGQAIGAHDITGSKSSQAPANAVSARVAFRMYDVSSDGYAWFHRPYVGVVKASTDQWNAYSPGSDRTVIYQTNARIGAEETARADAVSALATRASTLESSVNNGTTGNVALQGKISDEATTRSNQDSALSGRISTTEAKLNGDQDSKLAANIRDEATARVNADSALSSRVTTIESSAGSSFGLNANGDFMLGGLGWAPVEFDFPPLGGNLGYVASSRPGVYGSLFGDKLIKVADLNRGLHLQCFYQVYGNTSRTYIGLSCFDSSGGNLGNIYSTAETHAPGGYQADWTYKGVIAGAVPPVYGVNAAFPAGTAFVRPLFFANYPDSGGPWPAAYTQITQFWIEEVGAVQQVSARVSDEATTRANADTALSNRVSTTEAQMRGDQDSTLAARIRDEATARANAVSAVATRASNLEATASGGTTSAKNDNFANWPDGQTLPTAWGNWLTEGNYRVERVGGIGGSPYAIRTLNDHAEVSGFVQSVRVYPGKWVFEVTAESDPSGLRGAGLTLSGVYNLDFLSVPDVSGYAGDKANAVRSWSMTFDIIHNETLSLHAMHGWSGFGRGMAAKYMTWHKVSLRPAGPGDLAGVKNATDIASANSRIGAEETARADAVAAVAGRTSTLESNYNTVRSNLDQWNNDRYNDFLRVDARVGREETARSDAINAVANRTSVVEAQVSNDSNNLLRNATFNAPGWGRGSTGIPPYWGGWAQDNGGYIGWNDRASKYGAPCPLQIDRQGDQNGITQYVPGPIAAGWYVIEADVDFEDGNHAGSGVHIDLNNGYARNFSFGTEADTNGGIGSFGNVNRKFSTLFYNGANSGGASLYLMAGWTGFTGISWGYGFLRTIWHKVVFRPASEGEIAARKVQDANITARVTQTESAINNLNGRSAAYWQVEAVAGGRARLRAYADNFGSNIDIAADSVYLGNQRTLAVENGRVTVVGDLHAGSGRIIFDNGSVMKVSGTGFGSANQFIEWFGPRQTTLTSCTETNANYYLKIDGSCYFGGTLSAGVLKNSVQTSTIGSNAAVTTGYFGSNGRPRVVTVSFSLYGSSTIYGGCPFVNAPYGTVRLYRGDSSNGVLLAEQQFTGQHSCVPGFGQFEPGGMQDSIGGSFTYTDNSGGASASYYVCVTAMSVNTTIASQSLGVTSIEQ